MKTQYNNNVIQTCKYGYKKDLPVLKYKMNKVKHYPILALTNMHPFLCSNYSSSI